MSRSNAAKFLHRAAHVLALTALALPTTAQNVLDARTASVLAYWKPGDERVYDMVREKTGPKPGKSSCRITLRVLSATESSYMLECLYDSLTVEAAAPEEPKARAVFGRLLRATEGMRVLFETDELGIPLRIVNEEELDRHARKVLDEVLQLAEGPAERARMEDALAPVLDAETLAQEALEDIGNLLFPFGVAYILGKKEEVVAEVPNPLGGPPLRTRQEFTMTVLDSAAATARMLMEQRTDPKDTGEDMERLLDGMGTDGMTTAQAARLREALASVRITDTMDLLVDLKGAWTTWMQLVRETEVGGVRETDARTYVLR